jgi:hypothetical protein
MRRTYPGYLPTFFEFFFGDFHVCSEKHFYNVFALLCREIANNAIRVSER